MIRKILDKAKDESQKLTAGEKTLYKLHIWIKAQDRESIIALDHHGKINKQKLKAQSGINPRTVQSQNTVAAKLMRRMERHLLRSKPNLENLVPRQTVIQARKSLNTKPSGHSEPVRFTMWL
ncbi:hypothetical protein KW517_11425 [Vibrio fluvialis]|nr:hypothetical protein [Vibrio fluvialis]